MLENRSRVLNTAAYCRVSTDNLEQITSYELQKAHYEEMILSHPEWHLSGIYADEGTTETNTLHRDGFRQLMQDCDDGKIDLIITKSVSRFARNLIDCLDNVRRLEYTSGIPHLINNVCRNSLIYAYQNRRTIIDDRMVQQVIDGET